MHEAGLAQEALDIVLNHAMRADATRVSLIRLRIGDDAGVVPDAVTFALHALSANTIARDAAIEIERAPVRCWCRNCNREFGPDDIFYECPYCEKMSAEVRSGREFELVSVEVD